MRRTEVVLLVLVGVGVAYFLGWFRRVELGATILTPDADIDVKRSPSSGTFAKW